MDTKEKKEWENKGYRVHTLESLAEEWGVDYQAVLVKLKLVDTIRSHCKKKKISQRKLASMVEGLTQDRVSKMFSGLSAGMTIDKLVQILSALDYKLEVKITAPKS